MEPGHPNDRWDEPDPDPDPNEPSISSPMAPLSGVETILRISTSDWELTPDQEEALAKLVMMLATLEGSRAWKVGFTAAISSLSSGDFEHNPYLTILEKM